MNLNDPLTHVLFELVPGGGLGTAPHTSHTRVAQILPDLPLVFHPAATGARWSFTPFGAG